MIVHTGPKIQDGGVKNGFIKVGYQVLTELNVNIEPINPALSHKNMKVINLRNLFTII